MLASVCARLLVCFRLGPELVGTHRAGLCLHHSSMLKPSRSCRQATLSPGGEWKDLKVDNWSSCCCFCFCFSLCCFCGRFCYFCCVCQAMLCSMLPMDMLEAACAAASSEDPLARNWLPKLLHWFHQTFAFSTQAVTQQPAAGLDGSSSGSRPGCTNATASNEFLADFMGISNVPVQLQLVSCVEARKGSSIQLSILLVALLRAVGFFVRSVW